MNKPILATDVKASAYIKPFLEAELMGKIHSVFDHGLNILLNKQLIYVGDSFQQPLSSVGILIEANVFKSIKENLEVNQLVKITNQQWVFYTRPIVGFKINTIKYHDLNIPKLDSNSKHLQLLLHRLENNTIYEVSGFHENQRLTELFHKITNEKKLERADIFLLIGSGIGLTPSGDDFLQGIIMMEQALAKQTNYLPLLVEELENRNTTDISQSYYKAVLAGQVNEQWLTLIQAVNEKDEKAIDESIQRLKKYGHTSGADTLLGVQAYLNIIL